MTSSALVDAQQEVQAMTTSFPEAIGEHSQADGDTLIVVVAETIRRADAMLERIQQLAVQDHQSETTIRQLMYRVRGVRALAFALMTTLNPDQAWFWTPEWQAGEREADAAIAAGRTTFYASDDEFDRALRERMLR